MKLHIQECMATSFTPGPRKSLSDYSFSMLGRYARARTATLLMPESISKARLICVPVRRKKSRRPWALFFRNTTAGQGKEEM